MTDLLADDDSSTPLSSDELQGSIPSYITHRRELNEAEQAGIVAADGWAFAHQRRVWKWPR